MRRQQRGVTFLGMIFVGIVIAAVGVVAAQVVPTVIEFQAVQNAVNRAAQGQTVAEVRSTFDKYASIDDISSVKAKDLQISKENDKVVVAFAYEREIHLAGPAWLVMRYTGRSR